MPIVDLLPVYNALSISDAATTEEGTFVAMPIPGLERHRVAMSAGRLPSLLLASRDVAPVGAAAPIHLEKLSVEWDRACLITTPSGNAEQGLFTVIRCTDEKTEVQLYFLRVASALVATLGPEPRRLEVARALESMIELFRALALPARKSIQGLWGEVFVMSEGRNSETLVAAWHALPEERFDFTHGADFLEVKSAAGHERQHYFSLAQLRGPAEANVIVASLFAVRVGSGLSLRELLDRLRTQLKERPDLILKLDTLVGSTLGVALREGLRETFDEVAARTSLAFYDAAKIPSVSLPVPEEVTEIHFRVDLSGLEPLDLLRSDGGALFAAAIPRPRLQF